MYHREQVLGLILILLMGCSSAPDTTAVQGTVSFDGRPIEKGEINFVPIDGTPGASAVAGIVNGKYSVPSNKWGLLSTGTYQVRITAFRKTGRKERNAMEPGGPVMEVEENFIPPIYNNQSTLKLRVVDQPDKDKVDFKIGKTSSFAIPQFLPNPTCLSAKPNLRSASIA